MKKSVSDIRKQMEIFWHGFSTLFLEFLKPGDKLLNEID